MINKYKTELIQMQEPLVSIKMITYNHLPFIARAIEGVLQQKTSFPFELVIGEDCSTDGTRMIVFEYQKKYPDIIRVVTSDKNVGMINNSYRTYKACRGKYIAFCEGDDYWHHLHKLQKQVDYLESHPECGLVFTDYDFYFDGSKRVIRRVNYSKGFHSPMNLTIEQAIGPDGGVIRTCTIMFRKKLYKQVIEGDPYLHQNFLMGDIQLFAEMTQLSAVSYYPESMATYRIHEESATRSKELAKPARFCKSACEAKLYLCDKYKLPEDIRRNIESGWCDSSLRLAFHTGSAELADEVRKKKKTFTLEERFRYYGARNPMLYYPLRLAASFRNLFIKKYI
jgi:glycosyltransferase involved in cell wall biosynthesis